MIDDKNDDCMYVLYILRYTFEGPDLMIANVEPDDEGVYTCQVITKLDMAEASGTLTLFGKMIIEDYRLYDQTHVFKHVNCRHAVCR